MKKIILTLSLLALAFTLRPTLVDLDASLKRDAWVWDFSNGIGVSVPEDTLVHVSRIETTDGTHYNCLMDWQDASYEHDAWIACPLLDFSP